MIDVVTENGKKEEITIDSAAEESVCPERWAESCGIERVEKGEGVGVVWVQWVDHQPLREEERDIWVNGLLEAGRSSTKESKGVHKTE